MLKAIVLFSLGVAIGGAFVYLSERDAVTDARGVRGLFFDLGESRA